MAEPEVVSTRSPEPLIVHVLRTRNMRGQRGDTVSIVVKVEFAERNLGESVKVDCVPEKPTEINYQAKLNVTFEDPLILDELASRPVVLTFIEVLPKEKKQKEEKTVVLGQCTLDLLPMLEGLTKHQYTLPICALPGSAIDNLNPDLPTPEVDVQLLVTEPLLSEPLLQDANLLSITLETLYSPPDTWQVSSTPNFYTAALPVPNAAQKDNIVVLTGGALKPAGDKEPVIREKKWPNPGNAEANAIYIHNKMVCSDEAVEDESGEMKSKDDRDHRHIAETEKLRVSWNQERRCYLNPEANNSLQDKIAKTRYWPVEIYRMPNLATGGKGKKEEEGHISFHGITYVNLSPLLYPGVSRVRGAYKVVAYRDSELQEKTKRTTSVADESMKIATGILNRGAGSPFPKPGKGGKDDGKAKDVKKGAASRMGFVAQKDRQKGRTDSPQDHTTHHGGKKEAPSMKASDAASDSDGNAPVNAEGQQYTDNKSYVMIEITLQRPLVAKRKPEELAKRVSEYIPPRPLYPKRTDGAQRSVEDFHSQIGKVAALILADFREQFGEEIDGMINTPDAIELRRQQLLFNLNSSGKYFAFKEQLKHSVVKIVREKYLKTTNFKDKDQLQSFLSELYVYLLDQMHVGLNKVLSIEDQSPVPEPLTDSAQLKHFAREAEVTGDLELATKYYKERITRDRNDPDHWFDYGTFCLYAENLTEAEECFKECVAIDQRHLYGLLLYGIVCGMQDKHDTAETFLEAAVSLNNESILAWTMLGLFYNGIGNEIRAEMAFMEANKINVSVAVSHAKALKEEEDQREAERLAEQQEIERQNRELAGEDGSALPPAEDLPPTQTADVVSKDGNSVVDGVSTHTGGKQPTQAATPTSQTSEGKKTTKSVERKGSAKKAGSRPSSHRPKSGVHAAPPVAEEGLEEMVTPRDPTPVPEQTIFMQTMDFLLEVKATPLTERALGLHLIDSLGGESAEYHICMARMLLQKHQEEEAEESLKQALEFDHQNADAWALMGHVKYLLNHTEEAKSCYERTLAFVSEASEMHSIYLRLASMYLLEAKFEEAKNTFLLACKRSPSCVSWLGVGMACFRLGELSEAEDALSEANILNNANAEVWAYLSLVCLRGGRKQEAEQAYKFAIKLNLVDELLINEMHDVQEEVGFGNPQL